jgi:hypothetical protein
VVSAVLDALATLPGPLLLAVVCAATLLETAVLAGLVLPGSSARAVADELGRIGWGAVALGVPVGLVVATRRRRRTAVVAAAAA